MGFSAEQKRDFVAELQHYLYVISFHDSNIPHIVSDGIYGKETAQAVRMFQLKYGLAPTGETDCRTWDRIIGVYKQYLTPEPLNVISDGFVLSESTPSSIICIIQALLRELCERFANLPPVEVCGVYNEETKECIRKLSEICGTKNCFDRDMWNMIAREHNSVLGRASF